MANYHLGSRLGRLFSQRLSRIQRLLVAIEREGRGLSKHFPPFSKEGGGGGRVVKRGTFFYRYDVLRRWIGMRLLTTPLSLTYVNVVSRWD